MIRLGKFDGDSYADLISWVDSEQLLMQFAGPAFHFPLTHEQLDTSLSDKNRIAFSVLNEETNASIGHAEIYLSEHTAYLGSILIGDVRQRGKGIGQEIVNLLLDFIFSDLGHERVELNVFDWNVGAINCYEKVGFVINEGREQKRKIRNESWTAINMTIEKSAWQFLKAPKADELL